MSGSVDIAIRQLIREELRAVLGEELRALLHASQDGATQETLPVYMSIEKAAAMLDVSPSTVRGWIKSGALPCHGTDRVWRVRLDELEAFLRAGAVSMHDTEMAANAVLATIAPRRRTRTAE
jgi:excisionase family DNA binding protein